MLADGEVFEGEAIGALPPTGSPPGELVFNTVLSGYQEVITDPSYAGQVIAFTYPHIGNYGVTAHDDEAPRPWCRGVVVRDLPPRPSSLAGHGDLEDFLVARICRASGDRHPSADAAPPGRRRHGVCLRHGTGAGAAAPRPRRERGTTGCDLVDEVSRPRPPTSGARALVASSPMTSG